MKQILTFLLLLSVQTTYCQTLCDYNLYIDFDDTSCLSHLTIDTITNPLNIWQIGHYQKSVLDTTACPSKIIITDTVHPYPVNNTSAFIIRTRATMGIIYGCRMFHGKYYVQTDSLKDYGRIEFSPDKGLTWIDILTDTVYDVIFTWYSPKPVLTGNSYTCRYIDGVFGDVGSAFNLQQGDTLLFRFSFISDSIFDNLGGLMFDEFNFYDFVEGISEIRFNPVKSSIYPNPTADIFTIEFENPLSASFELSIYNLQSKLVLKKENITGNKIVVHAKPFKPDVYIYKLTNLKDRKRCWGKFITSEY